MMRICRRRKTVLCMLCLGATVATLYNFTLTSNDYMSRYANSVYVRMYSHGSQSGIANEHNDTTEVQEFTDGYNLGKMVHVRCHDNVSSQQTKSRAAPVKIIYSTRSGDLELCSIWKIGTTFIKRVFAIKNENAYKKFINPYNISFSYIDKPKSAPMSTSSLTKRFMFARNPYNRLLSGYVDKLLAPNPVYWKIIGVPAIRLTRKNAGINSLKYGHDLRFDEFIKYVISALQQDRTRSAGPDWHFERMSKMCLPCSSNYDFIGKMETFGEDSLELIRQLNLSQMEHVLKTQGASLAADDSLRDTVNQPFDPKFRKEFTKCISIYEALKRAWEKLQIRGIIGRQPLVAMIPTEAETLTHLQFTAMARKARENSTSMERAQLQQELFIKMFSTVSLGDLEKLRKVYAEDFKIFDYDDKPALLFKGRE